MGVRFAGLDADAAEEGFVVFFLSLSLPLALGAVDGPALEEGVRLGGLKGSLRFFWAGGSPAILNRCVGCVKCEVGTDSWALIKPSR